MSTLLFNQLILKGDFLDDIVSFFPGSIHIKDAKSHKYLISNQRNLCIYGLKKPEEIVGRTVNDLDSLMKPFWGDSFSNFVSALDYKVIKNKEPGSDNNRMFLTSKGFVHIQNMTKMPVFSSDSKVIAILTFSEAITYTIDLFKLYDI